MFSKYIKNTESNNFTRGPHPAHKGGGARPTPWARPLPRLPPGGPSVALFCYMESFDGKKIISHLFGRNSPTTRRNLGGTNLGLWRSCSAGDTSLREGEIITNDPLIKRGLFSINIFTSTISSQNASSSLVSNLVSKPQIGACGLLVVLITPCS